MRKGICISDWGGLYSRVLILGGGSIYSGFYARYLFYTKNDTVLSELEKLKSYSLSDKRADGVKIIKNVLKNFPFWYRLPSFWYTLENNDDQNYIKSQWNIWCHLNFRLGFFASNKNNFQNLKILTLFWRHWSPKLLATVLIKKFKSTIELSEMSIWSKNLHILNH